MNLARVAGRDEIGLGDDVPEVRALKGVVGRNSCFAYTNLVVEGYELGATQ